MSIRRQPRPGIRGAPLQDVSARTPIPGALAPASSPPDVRAPGPPPQPAEDARQGSVIDGRYRIEQKLGSGGMAQVYLGIYLKTGVKVAIKLLDSSLSSDMAIQRRCLDEARAMMELQSSHVVRALDVGSLPSGQLYIVMEYLDGEDLNALLVREGPLPWPRVGDMAVQICSGLATAHRRGIIHRDIKPQNCFRVTIDDNPEHIKLIDFGVARDLKGEAGPTQDGFLIGTPEYTAPELVQGMAKASARTDIYALGVMLYKLLTGTVPFQGATPVETLRKHVRAPLQPPSRAAPHLEIPPAADEIIERALARDPERRFASAEELSRAIKSALGLQRSGIVAQPQGLEAPPRPDAPARRPEAIAPTTRPPSAPPPSQAPPDRPHPGTAVDPTKDAALPVAIRPRPEPPQTRGAPPGEEPRSVDRKSVALRLISLMSLSLLFVVGTKLVSPVMPAQGRPSEADPPPSSSDDAPRTAATAATPGPAEGLERREAAPQDPPPVEVRPEGVEEPGKPQTESEPAKTEPELPPDTVDDSPPEMPPPVEEAATVREPEPLFDYTNAKKLVDDEVDYLRKTCLARAKQPTTRLKLRVDVRATGWPVVKIFSIDRAVRACVRGLFVFPFKRSPRGGAFVYSLSEAGTSIQRVPLELEEKSE
jgi:serine/threonine protein kinase